MVDDEFALRRSMERATIAQTLLENEIVKEAFDTLEEAYIATWKATPARDTEGREKLWQATQVIGKVKTHLEMTVASGQLSSRQIERDFSVPKRFGIV